MSSIQTAIELSDRMSAPLYNICTAVNMVKRWNMRPALRLIRRRWKKRGSCLQIVWWVYRM